MPDETEPRFRSLLTPLFPKEASFRSDASSDGLCFMVNWKLKNDSSRPNKRSKLILIRISQETIEDYGDGDQLTREDMEKRIMDRVKAHLDNFDPDHNTSYGHPEPEEYWYL